MENTDSQGEVSIDALSFQIYTMFVNRKDLLVEAIQSLGPYATSVVVLDNSPKQDLVLDGVPGEIVTPSVPLFCSQSYNLILKMALARKQQAFFIMHSDAEASEAIITSMLVQAAQLNSEGRRWGVLFANYDVLCLSNTPVVKEYTWDPYLPLYYTDVDYYRRMQLDGVEILETGLPVIHKEGGSSSMHANPALKTFVTENYPGWRGYYLKKWGGERGKEQFMTPFNQTHSGDRKEASPVAVTASLPQVKPSLPGNTLAEGNTLRTRLRDLEPVLAKLRPIYRGREGDTRDISWRLVDREFPISLSNEEGFVLYQAILRNRLMSGYEVATGFGMSSFWAGLALKETGGTLVSLDCYVEERTNRWDYLPQEADVVSTGTPLGLHFATDAAAQLGLADVVSYHKGCSPTSVPTVLAGRSLDYVYIDGLHSHGQPLEDFRAIAPYLAERCLIAFHSNMEGCDVPMAIRAAEAHLGTSAMTYATLYRLTLVGRDVSLSERATLSAGRIVIATHNGVSVLPRLLQSMEQFGTSGYELLVVDTGTTDRESLDYLEQLSANGVTVVRTPYGGYDTGAYLWAYRNYPAERYLFLQDSLVVTRPDWMAPFRTDAPVVALAAFELKFDNPEQSQWLTAKFPARQLRLPYQGIFGPIFAVNHTVLEELDRQRFLDAIPTCKQEQQAMERGWAIAFASCGIEVRYIVEDYTRLNTANAGLYKLLLKRS